MIVATDAALLPGQCDRLAQRAALGIGRVGGAGEHASGDIILAFATGNRGLRPLVDHTIEGAPPVEMAALPADRMDGLFYAVIEATEEAIVNALVAGQTMTGRDGTASRGSAARGWPSGSSRRTTGARPHAASVLGPGPTRAGPLVAVVHRTHPLSQGGVFGGTMGYPAG